MARNNIKFTTTKRILAEEFIEGDSEIFKMDTGYKLRGKELIETGSSENISINDNIITCTELNEGEGLSVMFSTPSFLSLTYNTGSSNSLIDYEVNYLASVTNNAAGGYTTLTITDENNTKIIEVTNSSSILTTTQYSYTFNGWKIGSTYLKAGDTYTINTNNGSPAIYLDITRTVRSYNITYNYKTATGADTTVVKNLQYGQSIIENAPVVPARTDLTTDLGGYDFASWSYSSSTVTGTATITAQYDISYFDYSKLASFTPIISYNSGVFKISNISELGNFKKGQLNVGLVRKRNGVRESSNNSFVKYPGVYNPKSSFPESALFAYHNRLSERAGGTYCFEGSLYAKIGTDGIIDSSIIQTFETFVKTMAGDKHQDRGFNGYGKQSSYIFTGFYIYYPLAWDAGSRGMLSNGHRSMRSSNAIKWSRSTTSPTKTLSSSYRVASVGGTTTTRYISAERSNPSTSSYTFDYENKYGTTWYLTPGNKGVANSYAYIKLEFYVPFTCDVAIDCYQSSEVNYDYGIVSNIDQSLVYSKTEDISTTLVKKNFKGVTSGTTTTLTYENVSRGWHFITIKYRKDSSQNIGEDVFKFRNLRLIGDIDPTI